MLLWIEKAPRYVAVNSKFIKNVCKFIDETITCESDCHNDVEMNAYIKYLHHNHTATCSEGEIKKADLVLLFGQ